MKKQSMIGKKLSLYDKPIKMLPVVKISAAANDRITRATKFWPETKDDKNG